MRGQVFQISVSNGGVPKQSVPAARVLASGVEGDRQNDQLHHGGPDRAVCLFSLEVIERIRAEGHPIQPGSTGDNLTIEGLEWAVIAPGARLMVGAEVELEVVSCTTPCSAIRDSFLGLEVNRIKQDLHPGESRVYARVLREGWVRVGDEVLLAL